MIVFNYVILEENFDQSVTTAQEHSNQSPDFGDYNFLFRNCSDYTDAILNEATITGTNMEKWVNRDDLISIPIVRVGEASIAQKNRCYCS